MSTAPSPETLRVWTNPSADDEAPSLVALGPDALLLGVVPAADLDKVRRDLSEGRDAVTKSVPLSRLTRVEGGEGKDDLTLTYRVGAEKTEAAELRLADAAARDELLAALVERLGVDWDFRRETTSRLKAGLWPLLGVGIVALLAWALHGEALRPAGKARGWKRQLFRWLAQVLGPTGVLVLGGVALAASLAFLAYALANPPVRLVLEPLHPSPA